MSYEPTTDFLGLMRLTSGSIEFARMPGLDFAMAAMVRAGMFQLSVGQIAPIVNQPRTAWLRPALPSWTAEGVVFLWNATTLAYELATPELWSALLTPLASNYSFQSTGQANATISAGTSVLAIQRAGPVATALSLPRLADQFATGRALQIVDWSAPVVNHLITLTTPDGASIMKLTSWQLLSTADQLAGIMLRPAPELNGWIIAP